MIIFEDRGQGRAPTITLNVIWNISRMYGIICADDKWLKNIAVTI